MGELIESEPELYNADEEKVLKRPNAPPRNIGSYGDLRLDDAIDQLFDGDSDDSFLDEDDHKERVKERKAIEVKLNNSYTGPYP